MLTEHAPETVLPFPADTRQEAVLDDVKLLWNMVVALNNSGAANGKDLYTAARELFATHNAAVNPGQVDEARKLQAALRTLLGQPLGDTTPEAAEESFHSLFASAVPAEPPAADPVELDQDTPVPPADAQDTGSGDDGGDGGDDNSGDDSDEDPADDASGDPDDSSATPSAPDAQAAATPAANVTPIPRTVLWDAQALGSGLLSGLARTLRPGDALQLVVVRTGEGELTVNLIPRKLDGEPDSVNTDLTVRGTPAELDLGLLEAVPTYQEVRKTVRELAADLLEQTQRKAQEAKANAAKPVKAAAKPAPSPEGTLKIDVTNPGLDRTAVRAAITGKGVSHAGKLVELSEKKLAPGTYTVEISADDHDIATAAATVKVGKTEVVKVTLKPRAANPLF
ncbi:PRTRC system protein E [Deinococcus ficus]|uniref:Uncharacterized protein n=1 Tax=Deinococcus ficus TaxID=317577 RepID=A0A221T2Z0_9DEIO|nr:PRTRC system protein E [Deinococcus ficus]ASN83231.1 hypothetical protein DFI_18715 [Deinococcus ficus]